MTLGRDRNFEYSVLKALGLEGSPGIQKLELTLEVGCVPTVKITQQLTRPEPLEVTSQYYLLKIQGEDEELKSET